MFEFNHKILRTKLNEKMAGVQKRGGEVRYCLYGFDLSVFTKKDTSMGSLTCSGCTWSVFLKCKLSSE